MNVVPETTIEPEIGSQADHVVHTNLLDAHGSRASNGRSWTGPAANNSRSQSASDPLSASSVFAQPPVSPPPPASNSRKRASVLNRTPGNSTTTAAATESTASAVAQDAAVDMPETNEYYGSMLQSQSRPLSSTSSKPKSGDDDDHMGGDAKMKTRTMRVRSQVVRSLGVGAAVLAILLLCITTFYFSRHTRTRSYHQVGTATGAATSHHHQPIAAIDGGDSSRLALFQSLMSELEELKQPEERLSVNGELNTTLHVSPMHYKNGPISFWTRAYERSIPGPTLRVKPGDVININLVNQLEPNVPGQWTMNTNHNPNTTNLHVHGMHVDPTGIEDNILRIVSPGESALTQIHVPKNHPRGLFHYHPHYHGSVFAQMGGGMVGALFVDHDDDDKIPEEYKELKQQVMVMQEFRFSGGLGSSAIAVAKASRSRLPLRLKYTMKATLDDTMQKLYPHVHHVQPSIDIDMAEGLKDRYASSEGSTGPPITDYFTVNGQYIPKIEIRPNENRILRFVNAGGVCALQLSVPGCSMTLAATDGIYLKTPRSIRTLLLSTGSRADVVFNCQPNSDSKHDDLEPLRPLQSLRDPSMNGFLGTTTDVFAGVVAMFHVKGESLNMKPIARVPAPSSLYDDKASLLHLSAIDMELMDPKPFEFEFSMGGTTQKDGFTYKNYFINGEEFDGKSKREMPLGIVQEWVVINRRMVDGSTAMANHPFHLHTNAFQIVAMSHGEGVEYNIGDWRDVISVPTPGNVTIRFRPVDYTGLVVAHCHVLGHSDGGMIAAVNITP